MTSDEEKQWLRQKFLEYKVKKRIWVIKIKNGYYPASGTSSSS